MVNLSKQIKEYIDFCECMKGVSEKTKAAYQIDLKQFRNWHGNDYEWCNKPVILAFISFAYKAYKPRTAKRKIASLKAFFHYLETEEIIEYDPFHKINYKRKEALILPRTFPSSVLSKILNYAYASFNSNTTNEYSSDTRVASVNGNGVVTGKRVGTTTITAVTSSGAKLSWEVEVGFTWWQIFLIFTGIGAIMLPFGVAP